MSKSLKDYKAIIFDCYGTIIACSLLPLPASTLLTSLALIQDWEAGMASFFEPVRARIPSRPSIEEMFTVFGEAEGKVQEGHPGMGYREVLSGSFLEMCHRFGVRCSNVESTAFGDGIPTWEPYEDSIEALRKLSVEHGIKLTVLSNVDNDSFAETRKMLEKGWTFDEVSTAQDIGSYKPDLRNFHCALKKLKDNHNIEKEHVLSVAVSLKHDTKPANTLSMSSVWINRSGATMGVIDPQGGVPDWTFDTLRSFEEAVANAQSSRRDI